MQAATDDDCRGPRRGRVSEKTSSALANGLLIAPPGNGRDERGRADWATDDDRRRATEGATRRRARDAVVLDEPREFPQYGEHCFATYWVDPHGFKLEAVCHSPEES